MTGTVAAVIPSEPDGAARSWRKLVRAVQPGADSAFGLDGWFLKPDLAYELPEGAIIVTCDQYEQRRVITVMRAAGHALEVIKAWETKGPLGKRTADWVRRRLDSDAPSHKAVLLEEAPNLYEGRCLRCRNPVPAGAGHAWRDDETGQWKVYHRKGQCPPPPPPPQRVEPNQRGGPCCRCGGWVEREEGAAVLTSTPAPGEKPRYAPVHRGDCPPDPAPGPANQRKGWCGRCGEQLRPGDGCWQPREDDRLKMTLACHPPCDPPGEQPPWVLRAAGQPEPGDVILVRCEPEPNGRRIPQDAPGYRPLPGDAGLVQFTAFVLDTDQERRRPARWMQVRAATFEEAAPLLAELVAEEAAVQPSGPGFAAMHQAEQYRDRRPWLAEITGYDPKFGYERQFVKSQLDWRGVTGKKGPMHGAVHCWTLRLDRVYEAWQPDGYSREHRCYLRATPQGDVTEISREEVDAWLARRQPPAS